MKHRLNRPTWIWQVMRFLIASSRQHAFLDRAWIPWLFSITPSFWRKGLALRLLSLSPHYWVYQWTQKYATVSRRRALIAEYERNLLSRLELCDKLLAPLLRRNTKVLDFGCGPGFLAKAVSAHVVHITATDISRGVIACAKELNSASNLNYRVNSPSRLTGIRDGDIDLVYSFAVFQHLLKADAEAFLREFLRVLKPGGRIVCHMILKEPDEPRAADPSVGSWIKQRVNLRMVYFTPDEALTLFRQVGFKNLQITSVNSLAQLNDDIGQEHLIIGYRQEAEQQTRPLKRVA